MNPPLPVKSCSAGATATQIYQLPPCSNLTRTQQVLLLFNFYNITKCINVIQVRIQYGNGFNMAYSLKMAIWIQYVFNMAIENALRFWDLADHGGR